MIETSELYKQHFEAGSIQEYKVVISGVEYDNSVLYDVPTITQKLFDKETFTVGSFHISELNLRLKIPSSSIETQAPIQFHYRYVSSDLAPSEWIQKFSGKISQRTKFSEDVTTIQAKDKASNYTIFLDTDTSAITSYPASNRLVATMCATELGLVVDNIEDVYDGNNVEFPNEMTVVAVLQNIAKLSGGNWVVTEDDKLRLIVLENVIGVVPQYSAQSTEVSNVFNPISQVQVYWDDASAFEVGDDTGSTIVINTPWATQSSTDYIHSILNGYQYIPVQGARVYADPAIQLGDTFTYGDTEQLVASVIWHFDGSVTGDFDAPQNNDYNFDDPRSLLMQNEFKKKISLGDSYQGVSIGRQDGIQMLLSPDGSEENAIGRYYADLNRGMAFQTRDTIMSPWQNWLYFDMQEKIFKLSLYSTTEEVDEKFDGLSGAVQENASSIAINAQGIQQEVIERVSMGEQIIEETQLLVDATSEQWNLEFSRVEGIVEDNEVSLDELRTYYRYTAEEAIIGKSGDPMQFYFSNDEAGYRENGERISYWKGRKFYVQDLHVLSSIIIGEHIVESEGSNTKVRSVA